MPQTLLTARPFVATFSMTPSEYKDFKALASPKDNLRDQMTDIELIFTTLGEAPTTEIARKRGAREFLREQASRQSRRQHRRPRPPRTSAPAATTDASSSPTTSCRASSISSCARSPVPRMPKCSRRSRCGKTAPPPPLRCAGVTIRKGYEYFIPWDSICPTRLFIVGADASTP